MADQTERDRPAIEEVDLRRNQALARGQERRVQNIRCVEHREMELPLERVAVEWKRSIDRAHPDVAKRDELVEPGFELLPCRDDAKVHRSERGDAAHAIPISTRLDER